VALIKEVAILTQNMALNMLFVVKGYRLQTVIAASDMREQNHQQHGTDASRYNGFEISIPDLHYL